MRLLSKIYYDPSHPAYLSGVNKLFHFANEESKSKITLEKVKEFLLKQLPSQLHKPTRRKFRRQQITGDTLSSHIQLDTIDLLSLKKQNNGYAYIVLAICCLSRQVRLGATKTKTPDEVLSVIKEMLESFPGTTSHFYVDSGTEFLGSVKAYLEASGVQFVQLKKLQTKASLAERAIRTIKTAMFKYMTHTKTKKWISFYKQAESNYNNSVHRTIGRTPVSVTFANQQAVAKHVEHESSVRPFSFELGEKVRMLVKKDIMSKGYTQTFKSDPPFIIHKRLHDPNRYTLVTEMNGLVPSIHYSPELSKFDHDQAPRFSLLRKKGTSAG
jgi:hypothetical protein